MTSTMDALPFFFNHKWQIGLSPFTIISILKLSRTLFVSYDDFKFIHGIQTAGLKLIVENFSQYFDRRPTGVVLKPKLHVCPQYAVGECDQPDKCECLHVCPYHVLHLCEDTCTRNLSHDFTCNIDRGNPEKYYVDATIMTNFNLLFSHYIHDLNVKHFFNLFQQDSMNIVARKDLNICDDYNKTYCTLMRCPHLHVCLAYLAGICYNPHFDGMVYERRIDEYIGQDDSPCILEHSLITLNSKIILNYHKIPTNISLRTASLYLVGQSIEIKNKVDELVACNLKKLASHYTRLNSKYLSNQSTICGEEQFGNVKVAKICKRSPFMCPDEKICDMLHSFRNYHWQVFVSDKWVNFRPHQVDHLEQSFHNPNIAEVEVLPCLKKSFIYDFLKPGVFIPKRDSAFEELHSLMSTYQWKVEFKSMFMRQIKDENKFFVVRRMCLEHNSGTTNKPCINVWYVIHDNGTAVPYRSFVGIGNERRIEKKYLEAPTSVIYVKYEETKLALDFVSMTQTCLKTSKTLTIVRRPLYDVHVNNKFHHMESERKLRTFTTEVVDLAMCITLSTCCNLYSLGLELLSAYYITNDTLELKFNSTYEKVGATRVMSLLYGTSLGSLYSICVNGIDSKSVLNNSEKPFGEGVYFTNSFKLALQCCIPDVHGRMYVIVADVIIGSVEVGDERSTNIATYEGSQTVRTIIDSMEQPSMFAKTNKHEFIPRLILVLEDNSVFDNSA